MNFKENKILRIAISSILCFLIFKKIYSILTSILWWACVELRIENEVIIALIFISMFIVSLLILIFFYNKIIKNQIPSLKKVWILIAITILLHITMLGIEHFFYEYIAESNLVDYRDKYLMEFTLSETFDSIFPLIILIVFLIKLYRGNKTVGNNV